MSINSNELVIIDIFKQKLQKEIAEIYLRLETQYNFIMGEEIFLCRPGVIEQFQECYKNLSHYQSTLQGALYKLENLPVDVAQQTEEAQTTVANIMGDVI